MSSFKSDRSQGFLARAEAGGKNINEASMSNLNSRLDNLDINER